MPRFRREVGKLFPKSCQDSSLLLSGLRSSHAMAEPSKPEIASMMYMMVIICLLLTGWCSVATGGTIGIQYK